MTLPDIKIDIAEDGTISASMTYEGAEYSITGGESDLDAAFILGVAMASTGALRISLPSDEPAIREPMEAEIEEIADLITARNEGKARLKLPTWE